MNVAQSSHLQTYDYEPNSQVLTVQFANGSVYQYSGVPQTVFDTLQQNGGGGTYFWSKIRDQYPATKLVGPEKRRR